MGFFKPVIVCNRFPALTSTISKVLFPSAAKKSRCVTGSAAAWSNRPSTLGSGMDVFNARGGDSSAERGQTSQSAAKKPSVCFIDNGARSGGCRCAFRRGRGRDTRKARHTSRSRGAAFYGRCRSCARGRARWKKADVLPREVESVSVRATHDNRELLQRRVAERILFNIASKLHSGPSCVKFDAIHVVGNCAQLDGARLHFRRRIKETPASCTRTGR